VTRAECVRVVVVICTKFSNRARRCTARREAARFLERLARTRWQTQTAKLTKARTMPEATSTHAQTGRIAQKSEASMLICEDVTASREQSAEIRDQWQTSWTREG
jgi:hypothetical protein